jgi:PAS domain S-box-containing protein
MTKKWTIEYCTLKVNENSNHDLNNDDKDGKVVWLRDIINVISENGQAISLRGIMIDVTATKESEKN